MYTKIFLYKYRNLNKLNPIYNISIKFPNSNKKLNKKIIYKFFIMTSLDLKPILRLKKK